MKCRSFNKFILLCFFKVYLISSTYAQTIHYYGKSYSFRFEREENNNEFAKSVIDTFYAYGLYNQLGDYAFHRFLDSVAYSLELDAGILKMEHYKRADIDFVTFIDESGKIYVALNSIYTNECRVIPYGGVDYRDWDNTLPAQANGHLYHYPGSKKFNVDVSDLSFLSQHDTLLILELPLRSASNSKHYVYDTLIVSLQLNLIEEHFLNQIPYIDEMCFYTRTSFANKIENTFNLYLGTKISSLSLEEKLVFSYGFNTGIKYKLGGTTRKFPSTVLLSRTADCDEFAYLHYNILSALSLNVILINYPDDPHANIGIEDYLPSFDKQPLSINFNDKIYGVYEPSLNNETITSYPGSNLVLQPFEGIEILLRNKYYVFDCK